ncbi:GNAT family N-acetyltransferase [Lutimonas sp.]|uniref:GNAT family N-acetyltransferase n=1 Tax=Lutimonas sp. TaxID=1872403 RepID=UPI003D9B8F55
MTILRTERLLLNKITLEDAPSILALMNDKDWIRNIGDRGMTSIEDAEEYIRTKFITSYEESNLGFYSLILKESHEFIGIVGLIDREGIDPVDIGYGLLPDFRGNGFAFEASKAIYDYGYNDLKLEKIVAIVNPDNPLSIRLLTKLGLEFEKMVRLPDEEKDIMLFS